jgi:hypothetical protein
MPKTERTTEMQTDIENTESAAGADSSPSTGSDCRWERSEWPHPKFPQHMKSGFLPDVIWLRIQRVFRGGFMEEVTGWQSTDPNKQL